MFWPPLDVDRSALDFLTRQPFAHRGLHGADAPENSWAAFDRAVAAGVGIELDVRLTRDGDAVVFHDDTLERMTEAAGPVLKRTRDELAKLRLAGSGETIHTLHDTLRRIHGNVPVLIEAKSPRPTGFSLLCTAIRRALEGYRGPVAVMSFNPLLVGWFARNSPKIIRGLVITESGRQAPFDLRRRLRRQIYVWQARPHFLAFDVNRLPSRLPDSARRQGYPVLTWTVREPAQRELGRRYADQLIFEGDIPHPAS